MYLLLPETIRRPISPLGDYVVTAEASGFKKAAHGGITLNAGQTQRVDFRLQLGSARQLVTVTGNLPKVQTESGTISSVITGNQVSELNLIARTFVNLAILVPGAAPDGGGFNPSTVSNISTVTLPVNGVPGISTIGKSTASMTFNKAQIPTT